jgi:hypothetical protein
MNITKSGWSTKQVQVKLAIPFIGEISGIWEPDEAERRAAWELYVELVTRVAVVQLGPVEGLLREALSSLREVFGITREILRRYGPAVTQRRVQLISTLGGPTRPRLRAEDQPERQRDDGMTR